MADSPDSAPRSPVRPTNRSRPRPVPVMPGSARAGGPPAGCCWAAFLVLAGVSHLGWSREAFYAQVPPWLPLDRDFIVVASGLVEIALGAGPAAAQAAAGGARLDCCGVLRGGLPGEYLAVRHGHRFVRPQFGPEPRQSACCSSRSWWCGPCGPRAPGGRGGSPGEPARQTLPVSPRRRKFRNIRLPSGGPLDTIPALGSGVRGVSVSKCPRTAASAKLTNTGRQTAAKTKEALLNEQDLFGGAEGTRTPDPLHAMQVRYQLRHSPEIAGNPSSRTVFPEATCLS